MSDKSTVVNALVSVLASNNNPSPAERASDGRQICRRYKQGLQCGFGATCRYAHVDSNGNIANPTTGATMVPPALPGAQPPAAPQQATLPNGAILTFTNAATAPPPPPQSLAERVRATVGTGQNMHLLDWCGMKTSSKAVFFWACEAAWVVWRLYKRSLTGELPWRLGALPGSIHTETSELMRYLHPEATHAGSPLGDVLARNLTLEFIQMLKNKNIQPVDCEEPEPDVPEPQAAKKDDVMDTCNVDRLLHGLENALSNQATTITKSLDAKLLAIEQSTSTKLRAMEIASGLDAERARKKPAGSAAMDVDAGPGTSFGKAPTSALASLGSSTPGRLRSPVATTPVGKPGASRLTRSPFAATRIRRKSKPTTASSSSGKHVARPPAMSLSEQLLSIAEDEESESACESGEEEDLGVFRPIAFSTALKPGDLTLTAPPEASAAARMPPGAAATAPSSDIASLVHEAAGPVDPRDITRAQTQDDLRVLRISTFLQTLPEKENHIYANTARVNDGAKTKLNPLNVEEGIPADWLGTHDATGPDDTFTHVSGGTLEQWAVTLPEDCILKAEEKLQPLITFWQGTQAPAQRLDHSLRTFGIKWAEPYRRMPMVLTLAITLTYHEIHARDKIRSNRP